MANRFVVGARIAYLAVAWLTVVAVGLVVFLAGLSLFSRPRYWGLHMGVGHSLEGLILLLVVTAILGRVPRANVRLLVILFGVLVLQVILPGLRSVVPAVAALHPVNAGVVAWVAVLNAREAGSMVQATRRAAAAAIA